MAERLCKLRKYGGGSGATITPVGGHFTTPASSASVRVDCTGYDNVFMYLQRYSSGWAEVYVDLTTNQVSINYIGGTSGFLVTVTASNHIVSVSIAGANTQRTQPYIKY